MKMTRILPLKVSSLAGLMINTCSGLDILLNFWKQMRFTCGEVQVLNEEIKKEINFIFLKYFFFKTKLINQNIQKYSLDFLPRITFFIAFIVDFANFLHILESPFVNVLFVYFIRMRHLIFLFFFFVFLIV